jgi:hypothetical protein
MVEPHSIQDLGRRGVNLLEKQFHANPTSHSWQYTDLWILQSAIEDERFRALLQWKIEEFQRCGS